MWTIEKELKGENAMRRFKLVFKSGPTVVAEVIGKEDYTGSDQIPVGELSKQVLETEAFVERLTGLRLHIEMV